MTLGNLLLQISVTSSAKYAKEIIIIIILHHRIVMNIWRGNGKGDTQSRHPVHEQQKEREVSTHLGSSEVWYWGCAQPVSWDLVPICLFCGLPLWPSWYRICLQCGTTGFDPWAGKIPWRRERLPTPVFWPGEFHRLYNPRGHKDSNITEWLSHTITHISLLSQPLSNVQG